MVTFQPSILREKISYALHRNGDEAWKRPRAHHGTFGHFENPWPSGKESSLPEQFPFESEKDLPQSLKRIKVAKPNFNKKVDVSAIQATWLGHAGVLVQLPRLKKDGRPVNILVDPIFSERASPIDSAGPPRRLENPCKVEDLPQIDFFLTSHNHYDHLDYDTVKQIVDRKCGTTVYIAPLGVKKWFIEECGLSDTQVVELDWWESKNYDPQQLPNAVADKGHQGTVRITCVPAQHASARKGIDASSTLWAGFVVEQFAGHGSDAPERVCTYFAGDTGYRGSPNGETCPAFKEIGDKFGPIDFSAIPIWRGGTLSFISQWGVRLNPDALTLATHATPKDAVSIHQDVRSRSSLSIHFATFAGSEDEATYPISLLEQACRDAGVPTELTDDGGIGVTDMGETVTIPIRR